MSNSKYNIWIHHVKLTFICFPERSIKLHIWFGKILHSHTQRLYYSAHFNGLIGCDGSANYFCKVIIIMKDRAAWLKNLKTMFCLWSYLFQHNFNPLWPHVPEVSLCMGFHKQNFGDPLLNCMSVSAVIFIFLSVLNPQGLCIGSSSKEGEVLFTNQIYTFYYLQIWTLRICIQHISGQHCF